MISVTTSQDDSADRSQSTISTNLVSSSVSTPKSSPVSNPISHAGFDRAPSVVSGGTSIAPSQIFPSQSVLTRFSILGIELLLAIPLGLLLTTLWRGGIAWIVGGIMAGTVVLYGRRSLLHQVTSPNATARKLGQALVGLAIGFSVAHSNWAEMATNLPVFAGLTVFLLLSGTAIGYIYSCISKTNLLTSMLATVPGGVSIMSSLAADYGKNVALVSLVQIIRVTAVIIVIPLIARVFSSQNSPSFASLTPVQFTQFNPFTQFIHLAPVQLVYLAVALLLTWFATILTTRAKVPAAPFVGGLVVGGLFNAGLGLLLGLLWGVPSVAFSPPLLVNLLGQILLGITIGEYWGNKPTVGKRAIGYAVVSVLLTLVAGMVAAVLAMHLTSWDWLTCLLVTAPGGAPEMILVALSLDHHVEIVTAGHLIRLIAINASLPVWVLLFRYLDRHLSIATVQPISKPISQPVPPQISQPIPGTPLKIFWGKR